MRKIEMNITNIDVSGRIRKNRSFNMELAAIKSPLGKIQLQLNLDSCNIMTVNMEGGLEFNVNVPIPVGFCTVRFCINLATKTAACYFQKLGNSDSKGHEFRWDNQNFEILRVKGDFMANDNMMRAQINFVGEYAPIVVAVENIEI
jgi:hypothetical protein